MNGIIEDADDFLDEDEADYDKACLVEGYLGVVEVEKDTVLIIGDQPMMTASKIESSKYCKTPPNR